MKVEYSVITIPTVCSDKPIDNDLITDNNKRVEEMRNLHEVGFHVTQMTSFVVNNVAYITYYLERK